MARIILISAIQFDRAFFCYHMQRHDHDMLIEQGGKLVVFLNKFMLYSIEMNRDSLIYMP